MARACALTVFAALAACSSMKVETQWDKDAKVQSYKTYAWIQKLPGPEEAQAVRDPRIYEALVGGIDGNLARKGYTRVQPDQNPDLIVAVHGFASNRIEVNSYGYNYAPVGYYGPYGAMGTSRADVRQYRDGTLIIDFVDAARKELVWRGTASDSFEPGQEAKTIAQAIDKTLAEYPPPVAK